MQIIAHVFLFLLGVSSLCSCKHYTYIPQSKNIPFIHEKNEVVVAAVSDMYESYYLKAAYSFTDKYAAQFSAMSGDGTYHLEGGIGRYKSWDNKSMLSIYGGYGHGMANKSSRYFSVILNKLYIQPTIAVKGRFFDIGFTPSFYAVDFSVVNRLGLSETYIVEHHVRELGENMFFFYEPTWTMRFGYENIKFELQLTNVWKLNKIQMTSNETEIFQLKRNFSAGIIFDLY